MQNGANVYSNGYDFGKSGSIQQFYDSSNENVNVKGVLGFDKFWLEGTGELLELNFHMLAVTDYKMTNTTTTWNNEF
jgi:hypothetical protein